MAKQFELRFRHGHREHHYSVVKQAWGDTYRYAMNVDNTGVLFEPVEGGSYHAVIIPGQAATAKPIDQKLLTLIANELQKYLAK